MNSGLDDDGKRYYENMPVYSSRFFIEHFQGDSSSTNKPTVIS